MSLISRTVAGVALGGLLHGTVAVAATVTDYSFTVLPSADVFGSGDGGKLTINNRGDVVTVLPNFSGGNSLLVTSRDGSTREVPLEARLSQFPRVRINDLGQILVAEQPNSEPWRVVLIEPDGARSVIATQADFDVAAGTTDPALPRPSIADLDLNNGGDAVFRVATADPSGGIKIMRLENGGTLEVVDSEVRNDDFRVTRSVFGPNINDAGQIAYALQTSIGVPTAENRVMIVDPDGSRTEATIDGRFGFSSFTDINEAGVAVNFRSAAVGNGEIVAIDPDTGAQTVLFSGLRDQGVGEVDINDFGQVTSLKPGDSITLDDEVLIRVGDPIGDDGFQLGGENRLLAAQSGGMLNNLGQVAFAARLTKRDADGRPLEIRDVAIRADPPGATPRNPILPDTQEGNVTGLSYSIVNGLGLTDAIFVDPVLATEFDYVLRGGPLMTSLVIPTQDLGAESGIFDILFGAFSETIGYDEVLDFTTFDGFEAGLSSFTISGIDPDAGVLPDDPFVVGLTHARLGDVQLDIIGRQSNGTLAPIPLPAAAPLLAMALAGLAALSAGRKRFA